MKSTKSYYNKFWIGYPSQIGISILLILYYSTAVYFNYLYTN